LVKLFALGELPGLQSLTVFHALAMLNMECLIVVSPRDPIVSIGYFEEADESVDLGSCEKHNISVMRREIGGGTTYLDANQVFYQLVLRKGNPIIPIRIVDRYRLFSEPPIQTYRRFGLEVEFRPINDLCTKEGRKIAGEAGGDIGESIVFAGGILLDFDYLAASRIMRVPDKTFRDMLYKSMKENVTSMKRELGEAPQKKEVECVLVEEYEKLLGPMEPAELSPAVQELMAELEDKFTAPHSAPKRGLRPRMEVKVAEGVRVVRRLHQGAEGTIRLTMEVKNDKVIDIAISSDWAFSANDELRRLERTLRGVRLQGDVLRRVLRRFCEQYGVDSEEIGLQDLARTILAKQLRRQHSPLLDVRAAERQIDSTSNEDLASEQ